MIGSFLFGGSPAMGTHTSSVWINPKAELIVGGDRYIECAMVWNDRSGHERRVSFRRGTYDSMDALRQEARRLGWPGHEGGWWNYLKDDARVLWSRWIP